ncbi:MAG: ATPase P [Deltaproteobacteria bacterium]|nr:ATPase P [Deltaproteobacteria bacterium]
MITLAIPGREDLSVKNLILDLNGTIAFDGNISKGVKKRISLLSKHLNIFIVTADTNKNAEQLVKGLNVNLFKIYKENEDSQKLSLLLEKGKDETISIGNGANDVFMLKESCIGICVLGSEGAATEALTASNIVVPAINDALDLLLKSHRLIATMRK